MVWVYVHDAVKMRACVERSQGRAILWTRMGKVGIVFRAKTPTRETLLFWREGVLRPVHMPFVLVFL